MSPPSREEIEAGEEAEGLFRDFCDKFRITYVYLDQSSFNKSSRLVRENAARQLARLFYASIFWFVEGNSSPSAFF